MNTEPNAGHQARIAIIGAGLGGLSLARMMHVHGLRASLFDKDVDALERSIGGSLDMHQDGGLFAIEQAELFDRFQEIARYEDQGMRLFNRDGELLFEANDGNRPEIDRGQLRELFVNSIPAEWFHWNHDLKEIREAAEGGFELFFRGGQKEHADFVVGADGVWSRVRSAVTDAAPQYSGLTFFEVEIRNVDAEHPEVAKFISHGLNMAMAEGKLISAQRNASGHVRVYSALFAPEDGQTRNGHATVTPKERLEIMAQYVGWGEMLVHLFEAAGDSVRSWPIYTMPIGHRWTHKRGLTLIGDAAHVMPPAGDGANLAMRDGVDLACAFTDTRNIDQAISAFEAAMFERAEESSKLASAALLEGSSEDRIALIKRVMFASCLNAR